MWMSKRMTADLSSDKNKERRCIFNVLYIKKY